MGLETLGRREILGIFYQQYNALAADTARWENAVTFKVNTDQAQEEYDWVGNVPMMQEWIGPRAERELRAYKHIIKNRLWEATLGIKVDDLRRDKTGQIQARMGELASRAVEHRGKLLTDLIIAGETTAAYDGQFFFDTDHSEGDSGTLSNDLAAGDYGVLNVTTPAAPTPDEMANIIITMVQHQFAYKDDTGEPLNTSGRNFILMVPVNMWGSAVAAVANMNLNTGVGTRDNPYKAIQAAGFNVIPVANPRLTWTTKLALFRTDGIVKPFIYQEEYAPKSDMIGPDSEYTKINRRILVLVEALYNVGFGMWQHATLATLS
jgi:phage major head subunit gpT-like protein